MAVPLILPRSLAEERVKQGKAKPLPVLEPRHNHGARIAPGLAPTRKTGSTESSWIDQLTSTHKCVMLCHLCTHKFDHIRSHYYKDRKFDYVMADCDGCRKKLERCAIYFHESVLTGPGGRTSSGQCWTPR